MNTPTPWNLHRVYDGEIMAVPESGGRPAFVAASLIIARGEQIIADVKMQSGAEGGFPTVESHAEMKANAEFIIRACNSHAGNVAALKLAEETLLQYNGTAQQIAVIRAALEAAQS